MLHNDYKTWARGQIGKCRLNLNTAVVLSAPGTPTHDLPLINNEDFPLDTFGASSSSRTSETPAISWPDSVPEDRRQELRDRLTRLLYDSTDTTTDTFWLLAPQLRDHQFMVQLVDTVLHVSIGDDSQGITQVWKHEQDGATVLAKTTVHALKTHVPLKGNSTARLCIIAGERIGKYIRRVIRSSQGCSTLTVREVERGDHSRADVFVGDEFVVNVADVCADHEPATHKHRNTHLRPRKS